MDYGKLILKPEDSNVHFLVVSRQDKNGKTHQILYHEKFARILKESEKSRNIDSESEIEDIYAISDVEAEERRWSAWMKSKRMRKKPA